MSLVFLHPEIRLHKDEYFWQKNIYTNHLTSLFPLFPPSALCLYFSFLSLPHIFTECPLETSSYKTFPGKPSDFFILNSVPFPGGSDGKASACNVGDPGSIPGLGRSPGEGNGIPLQYSCLENSMDRGAW